MEPEDWWKAPHAFRNTATTQSLHYSPTASMIFQAGKGKVILIKCKHTHTVTASVQLMGSVQAKQSIALRRGGVQWCNTVLRVTTSAMNGKEVCRVYMGWCDVSWKEHKDLWGWNFPQTIQTFPGFSFDFINLFSVQKGCEGCAATVNAALENKECENQNTVIYHVKAGDVFCARSITTCLSRQH